MNMRGTQIKDPRIMKALAAISACAFLAAAAPALAASSATMKHELKANGSVNGAGYSHAAQAGDRGTEAGKKMTPKMSEGRAAADETKTNKATDAKMQMKTQKPAAPSHTKTPKMGGTTK
jgi:hypothetical protein